jgi:hypothetical protein
MHKSKLLGHTPDEPDQPSGEANQHQETAHDRGPTDQPGARRTRQIFSEQQCLEALTQLPGLITMGLVTPARANSIRSILVEILRHHQRAGRGDSRQSLDDDVVLEILRRDPTVVGLLNPLLTDDQIAMVMRHATSSHE